MKSVIYALFDALSLGVLVIVGVVLAGFIIVFAVVGYCSLKYAPDWQTEAIQHGAAEWLTTENGSQVFHWKERQ